MGAPWQVRVKLCVIGLALFPIIVGHDGAASRANAEEARASCVDPAAYTGSVVSISRYFDKARTSGGKQVIGERATAWFYTSPRLLVTAAHFASELPAQGWQEVELRREGRPDVTVRAWLRVAILGMASRGQGNGAGLGSGLAEDIAILELRDPFPAAQVLDIGSEMPPNNATVLVLGYPGGRMQAAKGVVRETGIPVGKYAGLTLLEVEGPNRLLLNGGTSGAPVLDCLTGQVIGVLNTLLTSPSLPFPPSGHAVIPTPWGSPTNTAVPASRLTATRDCIL
jgi:hypothetical protein